MYNSCTLSRPTINDGRGKKSINAFYSLHWNSKFQCELYLHVEYKYYRHSNSRNRQSQVLVFNPTFAPVQTPMIRVELIKGYDTVFWFGLG